MLQRFRFKIEKLENWRLTTSKLFLKCWWIIFSTCLGSASLILDWIWVFVLLISRILVTISILEFYSIFFFCKHVSPCLYS